MKDFLFHGSLADVDPDVHDLTQFEAERQARKLIMIPSESAAPAAVREALGSVFQNIYAEGYPDEETRLLSEAEILDYANRLAHYRRYADPRYYKGVEYADVIESLARRRCAELFATPAFPAEKLFVNVQPLSGAPANNAVYTALLNPGDTILGMNLLHGGHLSHGSPVNRSGKVYDAVHYTVNPETERIDFEEVRELAEQHKPKIIIAGYSSYSWVPDWTQFRAVADSVGAVLLADVSHIAGLVAAGVVPSPVGIAQVVTFTTHKTLCGPRGACIITTDGPLGRKIDRAVFPGEQGGPHIHAVAAMATAFKLAKSEQFRSLQAQIVKNCQALNQRLIERGMRIPFKGSDTHLTNVDCKTIVGPDGTPLSGDMASRILDIAGIVCNRNTIPGDKSAFGATGIRLGTPWITQRGLEEADMHVIADVIADVLQASIPYSIDSRKGPTQRAKVDFAVLEDARLRVRALAAKAGGDVRAGQNDYPHFYYLDDQPTRPGAWASLKLEGEKCRAFVNYAFSSNVEALTPGASHKTRLITPVGPVDGVLTLLDPFAFQFSFPSEQYGLVATWLRDLSDGYVAFDADVSRRMPGPIVVSESEHTPVPSAAGDAVDLSKPFFIGKETASVQAKPAFTWQEPGEQALKRTALFATHEALGARLVPFAGWEMPVQYTSVIEEHLATRQAAGLFDVSHMGVYQAEGTDAAPFLDCVCGNDIASLAVGESCYTHFLDQDAHVIDDLLVYRRSLNKFLVVVNASNDDKDWAWLNAVLNGSVRIDNADPGVHVFGRNTILRNLRDPKEGADMRVDIALQGPKSRDILLALGCDSATRKRIIALKRTELCEAVVGGFDLIVSRTGYTGEKMAFELFVHPAQTPDLWAALMKAGEPLGLKPCGLAARDSLRTEAGLPLYGHEMGGAFNLGVAEAGFSSFVKEYKPWFIGRSAYMEREKQRSGVVIRFRFTEKGVRVAHPGDPVMDPKGRVIGFVTSCSIDMEGFLTGQAFIELKSSAEGTPLAIYQSASNKAGKAPAELKPGDRVTLPTAATVVTRYPKLGS